MKHQLAIFNCWNDMALAADTPQYFPPARIQQMADDLSTLGRWWADDDADMPQPWGWSRAMKLRYKQMGVDEDVLPTDQMLRDIRRLSSREFACRYIQQLLMDASEDKILSDCLAGHDMRYVSDMSEIKSECNDIQIYKSLWSSSGRGVFVADIRQQSASARQALSRIDGLINKQGGIAVDHYYDDKVLDFALEYKVGRCDGDKQDVIEFLGFSVFVANDGGQYGYNIVASQQTLRGMIADTGVDMNVIDWLIEYNRHHLAEHLAGRYEGMVGIDMMVIREDGTLKVHPCVEINLRMNMGILAIILHQRLGDNATCLLTPEREHGFTARVDSGRLMIEWRR